MAFALAIAVGAGEARALSLSQAVIHALNTHPEIGESVSERQATKYELLQSKGRMLPEVDLEADIRQQKTRSAVDIGTPGDDTWLKGDSVTLSARQILFDGWERHYAVYKDAARLDAASLRLLGRAETTSLDVVEAYIEVRRHIDALSLARRNVERHNEILARVRAQFEGGKVPLSDVNQIMSRVASAEAVVAVMQKNLLDAEAEFRHAVGLDPSGLEPVAWPGMVPGSRTEAIAMAVENNPSVRAVFADADAADHARKENIGSFLPEVSLEGLARQSDNIGGNPGFDDEYLGRVVLKWRVFDGMIRHNRQNELSERVAAARFRTEAQRREVAETTEKAWASLTTGRDRVTALESQASASEKVVAAFLEEYELSRRTLLEVLDAESLLFNAKVQLVGARSVRLFSAYQLLASAGRLLESLGLEPPRETLADAQARELHFVNPFDVFLEPLTPE
jgi:adhesin transport system outer membrane protein